MKTSCVDYANVDDAEIELVEVKDALISPAEVTVHNVEVFSAERWSDATSQVSTQVEDVETVSNTDPLGQCEQISDMFYTASSEVSLLSDLDLPERVYNDEDSRPDSGKDERKECIAGHVAAMRERFESMTRTNTPCPDLSRSLSPSLDVFRNITPSPDLLG